jgi:energy-coupling factor transport system substrate-specific component
MRALEIFALIAAPLALGVCAFCQVGSAAALTLFVALVAIALMFASWEKSRPALRQIMPCVVLAALAAAGRIIFAAVPNVQPVTAIVIICGLTFGRKSGFMCGALAALVSNCFLGQGAWTPWQMYAWGLVGYVAGVLFGGDRRASQRAVSAARAGRCTASRRTANTLRTDWRAALPSVSIYIYGFVASFAYGFILNTWTLVGFMQGTGAAAALAVYAAGAAFGLAHAVSTVVFLALLYAPWSRKLARIKAKFA